jgi:hypothetical protein
MGSLPFFNSFSFLKTFEVSSVNKLSPNSHISRTEAPTTHLSITCFRTPGNRTIQCTTRYKIYQLLPLELLETEQFNALHDIKSIIHDAGGIMWIYYKK